MFQTGTEKILAPENGRRESHSERITVRTPRPALRGLCVGKGSPPASGRRGDGERKKEKKCRKTEKPFALGYGILRQKMLYLQMIDFCRR